MGIYLICPVYNRKSITENFLNQIHQQTYKNVKIIFIDSGSNDGTINMIENNDCNSKVIKGNGRWWWARSVNEGLKYINTLDLNSEDIVGIINDDVILADIYLENVNNFFNQDNDGILGSLLINQMGVTESGIFFDKENMRFTNTHLNINCCSTRGIFFKFSSLSTIGIMRQRLFPHYFSDYDLTLRANHKGMAIQFDTGVFINLHPNTHLNGKSNRQNTKMFSNANASNIMRRLIFIVLHCNKNRIPLLFVKEIKIFSKKYRQKL
jgi:GT2 family glycosyltransferase